MSGKNAKQVRRQIKRGMDKSLRWQFNLFMQQAFAMSFFDRVIVAICILRGKR